MSYPDYEKDVLRTLSLQFNLQSDPGGPFPTSTDLLRSIRKAVEAGLEIDQLKKSIFYGSPFGDASDDPSETPIYLGDDSENDQHPSPDILHSALGLFTEAAEFLEAILKSSFGGEPFDRTNAVEELGDLEWYMAVMRQRLAVSQERVQRINIAKLKARYPQKFAREEALVRDLKQERAILESAPEKD